MAKKPRNAPYHVINVYVSDWLVKAQCSQRVPTHVVNRFSCKWCSGQWHETANFGDQEVKVQGHTRPKIDLVGWLRGAVVERWSLTGELSVSCARLAADGSPLLWVNRPL